jgi:ssRNA-specific RNase YbeY (16S rRNA maturation enzyme)
MDAQLVVNDMYCMTSETGVYIHVEMNVRNSDMAVRILHEHRFMELHRKNVKTNDCTHVKSFVLQLIRFGNIHVFSYTLFQQ